MSLLVYGVSTRRRHAAEKPGGSATFAEQEKRKDLAKTTEAAAATAGTPVPTLSCDFQQLSFVQSSALAESTLEVLEKFLSESPYARTAAQVRLYAGSFGSSAIAYGLTKLLLCRHDNRQRSPFRRLP
jgi:hypothetical protein